MSQKIVKQLSKLCHGAISQSPTQPNMEVSGRLGEVYSNTMRNFIYESQHDKSVLKLVIYKIYAFNHHDQRCLLCIIFANRIPFTVVIFYLLSPIPTLIAKRRGEDSSG